MNIDVAATAADAALETVLIGRVGVVGAGQMGNGICHVCALAGMPVVLADVSRDVLDRAMATMARNLDRQLKRDLITADDKSAALARVATTTDYAGFAECDLVVEATSEKEEVKKAVYRQLIPHLKPRGSVRRPTARKSSSACTS